MKTKAILFLILVVSTSGLLISDLHLNDSDPIFPPAPDTPLQALTGGREEISDLLIDGAALFIDSYSESLLLLKEYESSGKAVFNLGTACEKLESTIAKLEASIEKYATIISLGEQLQYVEFYRNKLLHFDYDSAIIEKNLNSIIANEVKGYLSKGDVLGLYRRHLEKLNDILDSLKLISNDLGKGIKSDITLYWAVYQKFSETALFGNYSTVLSRKAFL